MKIGKRIKDDDEDKEEDKEEWEWKWENKESYQNHETKSMIQSESFSLRACKVNVKINSKRLFKIRLNCDDRVKPMKDDQDDHRDDNKWWQGKCTSVRESDESGKVKVILFLWKVIDCVA